jgi:GntR family transcriptional regulator
MSLVDGTEEALRSWLAPGRHRPGDRLPPEHTLAGMLGVSRGTLRTALERLEHRGEIVRRQGSGTFVGEVGGPAPLSEGLERLESYSSLARRRAVALTVTNLTVERTPLGEETAAVFGLAPEQPAVRASRVLLADGTPAAVMTDVIHPDVALPSVARIARMIERGRMVLDLLVELGVPIAFAETRIRPRLITPRDRAGKLLGVHGATAALELEEIMRLTSGETVQHSLDLFGPDGLDLHVIRSMAAEAPTPAAPRRA